MASDQHTEWAIYVLTNPRTRVVKYVGYTATGTAKRLRSHVMDAIRCHNSNKRNRWILSLLSIGLTPGIQVIETGAGDGWKEAERRWIAHYRANGGQLVNLRDGGAGHVPGASRRVTTHGLSGTPEHVAWMAMKARCLDLTVGKGAKVAAVWQNDFAAFLAHVGPRPSPEHRIDRFPDQAGDYEPGNVRWALTKDYTRSRDKTIMIEYRGVRRPLAEICEELGLKYTTIGVRRLRGCPDANLFDPPRTRRPRGSMVCLNGHSLVGNSYACRGKLICRACTLESAGKRYEEIKRLREDSRSPDGRNKYLAQ